MSHYECKRASDFAFDFAWGASAFLDAERQIICFLILQTVFINLFKTSLKKLFPSGRKINPPKKSFKNCGQDRQIFRVINILTTYLGRGKIAAKWKIK